MVTGKKALDNVASDKKPWIKNTWIYFCAKTINLMQLKQF